MTTNTNLTDPMAIIPEGPALGILSYMTPQELGICSQVSSKWKELATDPKLWIAFFDRANLRFTNVPTNVKNFFKNISVLSFDDLIVKVKDFTDQMTHNRQGEFICFFLNKGCSIRIRIGNCTQDPSNFLITNFSNQPDFVKQYVFAKKLPEPAPIKAEDIKFDGEDPSAPKSEMEKVLDALFKQSIASGRTGGFRSYNEGSLKVEISSRLPDGTTDRMSEIDEVVSKRVAALSKNKACCTPACQYIAAAVVVVAGVCFAAMNFG